VVEYKTYYLSTITTTSEFWCSGRNFNMVLKQLSHWVCI